ncbi:sensor domain-containing protein [Desulfolutivibrio sp.]|uniref:sensor domain-containing protein n=1 Tax=Desulfolutivibrio sp. TaxID=2773296 RepID=UPI002F96D0A6
MDDDRQSRDCVLRLTDEQVTRFLHFSVDQAAEPVYWVDKQGCFAYVNATACRMLGWSRDELVQMTVFQVDRLLTPALWEARWEQLQVVKSALYDVVHVTRDGRTFQVEVSANFQNVGGEEFVAAFARDVTDRRLAEQRLKLFEKVFDNALEGITVTDHRGDIVSVNPAFALITGYTAAEALGKNPRILKSDRHPPEFYKAMWSEIIKKGQWSGEIWNRRKSGEAYPEWLSISAIKDRGRTTHYVAVFHDISEMKRKEDKILHQASHDALTNLPNKLLLSDLLEKAISHAARAGHKLGVICFDLDNFKNINDTLGHAMGDELLKAAAVRISGMLRPEDTVARPGGDEFMVMLGEIADERDAVRVAERILDSFRQPFQVDGRELVLTASVGISIFPEDGASQDALIKHADLAMYRAKEQGKNAYQLFTPQMNEAVTRRLNLEAGLRRALERGEFLVHYQPRLSFANMRTVGMEALVRWRREPGMLVPPMEFIPLAEETGLIVPLGEFVMETACARTAAINAAMGLSLKVSVNLSARQFSDTNLPELVARILGTTGLPPACLEVEVTETVLMQNIATAANMLAQLAEMGVSASIDDFGTGYSSLYYLKKMPLAAIKIDRSFIRDIPRDPSDIAITTTIISMCRGLDLAVVAEGVETQEQFNFLLGLRCDECQGYLVSRPLPAPDFEAFLRQSGDAPG